MVDIHCHILPEVDDGAWDLEMALEMARMAEKCGVRKIIATPHFDGVPRSLEELPYVMEQFVRLRRAIGEKKMNLELLPGVEILCVPQTMELARQGRLPTLGDSRYVLAEFYFDAPRQFMDEMLGCMLHHGYKPVVAHPERYGAVQQDPDLIRNWFERGVVIQVNKGSVLGAFGHRAEDAARYLLDRGLVHVIASDAHSPERRTTDLEPVRRWAVDHLGRTYTKILLEDNPARIAEGKPMRSHR